MAYICALSDLVLYKLWTLQELLKGFTLRSWVFLEYKLNKPQLNSYFPLKGCTKAYKHQLSFFTRISFEFKSYFNAYVCNTTCEKRKRNHFMVHLNKIIFTNRMTGNMKLISVRYVIYIVYEHACFTSHYINIFSTFLNYIKAIRIYKHREIMDVVYFSNIFVRKKKTFFITMQLGTRESDVFFNYLFSVAGMEHICFSSNTIWNECITFFLLIKLIFWFPKHEKGLKNWCFQHNIKMFIIF